MNDSKKGLLDNIQLNELSSSGGGVNAVQSLSPEFKCNDNIPFAVNKDPLSLPTSEHVSVDAVSPGNTNAHTITNPNNDSHINDKFNNLIKKIENQRKIDESQYDLFDGQFDKNGKVEEKYNKDKALKQLYDDSVEFKNTLAQLRSQIKTLNGQFNSYDLKCNQLMTEEFGEYKSLKEKIQKENARLEEEEHLHEKRMAEKTNKLKVMQIEFLKQYQNVAKYQHT